MKERWKEMLEYQQKVQAMTDLERARAMMRNSPPTLAEIANALAAARREGAEAEREWIDVDAFRRGAEEAAEEWRGKLAEQCGKTLAAAYEMRERAAHAAEKIYGRGYLADAIRALPLTREEPT